MGHGGAHATGASMGLSSYALGVLFPVIPQTWVRLYILVLVRGLQIIPWNRCQKEAVGERDIS